MSNNNCENDNYYRIIQEIASIIQEQVIDLDLNSDPDNCYGYKMFAWSEVLVGKLSRGKEKTVLQVCVFYDASCLTFSLCRYEAHCFFPEEPIVASYLLLESDLDLTDALERGSWHHEALMSQYRHRASPVYLKKSTC